MLFNLLVLFGLVLSLGLLILAYAVRLAGVEDGIPLRVPAAEAPLDHAFRDEPVQTFMWQVQVARYWQPPFRRR